MNIYYIFIYDEIYRASLQDFNYKIKNTDYEVIEKDYLLFDNFNVKVKHYFEISDNKKYMKHIGFILNI